MLKLVALFIAALCVPTGLSAQTISSDSTSHRFIPLQKPDSLHARCVPIPGDTVAVVAERLRAPRAVVTALELDTERNQYVIEIDGVLRVTRVLEKCASRNDGFYVWERMNEDGTLTEKPVIVFPIIPVEPKPLFNLFFARRR